MGKAGSAGAAPGRWTCLTGVRGGSRCRGQAAARRGWRPWRPQAGCGEHPQRAGVRGPSPSASRTSPLPGCTPQGRHPHPWSGGVEAFRPQEPGWPTGLTLSEDPPAPASAGAREAAGGATAGRALQKPLLTPWRGPGCASTLEGPLGGTQKRRLLCASKVSGWLLSREPPTTRRPRMQGQPSLKATRGRRVGTRGTARQKWSALTLP